MRNTNNMASMVRAVKAGWRMRNINSTAGTVHATKPGYRMRPLCVKMRHTFAKFETDDAVTCVDCLGLLAEIEQAVEQAEQAEQADIELFGRMENLEIACRGFRASAEFGIDRDTRQRASRHLKRDKAALYGLVSTMTAAQMAAYANWRRTQVNA